MTVSAQLEDKDLIQAFRDGDTQAGAEIYQRYYPAILDLCRRRMRSEEDGQDTAQIVFLKVIGERKILEFRGESHLKTWLFRIAINACNSQFERRTRNREVFFFDERQCRELGETIACSSLSPEDVLTHEEEVSRVAHLFARLPDKYQQALASTYLEDRTYREAAHFLGIPIHSLGIRIMRGKQKLSLILEKNFYKQLPCSELAGNFARG